MTISGSIYFLGKYRPAHFEADTIQGVACRMLLAIQQLDDKELANWLRRRIFEGVAELERKNCSAWSSDHCDRGISVARRPHDPWLDRATADMFACPGLDYSAAVNS